MIIRSKKKNRKLWKIFSKTFCVLLSHHPCHHYNYLSNVKFVWLLLEMKRLYHIKGAFFLHLKCLKESLLHSKCGLINSLFIFVYLTKPLFELARRIQKQNAACEIWCQRTPDGNVYKSQSFCCGILVADKFKHK